MTLSAPAPCVVWRFVDGKPGHEKQSAGLLQGLEALLPLEVHEFDMRFPAMLWRQVRAYAMQRRQTPAPEPDLPAPNVLLGVGHRTHVPMLVARAACGGSTVVLMKPTLPHRWFDLIFVPLHDRYRPKANLVETRGVICPTEEARKEPREGLILLGGSNRHFEWPVTRIAAAVAAVTRAAPDIRWQVCDSPRTPAALQRSMPARDNLIYRHWKDTPSDFLQRAMAVASYVWVTADSASMLYEALSAGAHVGVIALDLKRPERDNKHQRGIEALRSAGQVGFSPDGYRLKGPGPAFQPENRRCAQVLAERLALV